MTAASIRRHDIPENDRSSLLRHLKAIERSDLDHRLDLVLRKGKQTVEIPASAMPAIMDFVSTLAEHGGASVVAEEDELTPEQAARFLGISRPMLMHRVKMGEIPHRMIGAHHRLKLSDIALFQKTQEERHAAMLDVSTHTQDMIRKHGL
jgi:excisionase family DNA binding protein